MTKTKMGIIGCGTISWAYFTASERFEIVDIVACADLVPERAQARAEEYGIPKACSVEELLADPEIEIVINLTIPKAHAEVSTAILEAGKHVYSEKPFTVDREDGRRVLELAREKGLRVGCAPDTFLGGGIQTCRKLLDDGVIGEPVAASAFMMGHGPESWHPDPEFHYKPGGGPLFGMGPYYLTTLVNLLGPVEELVGSAQISFAQRTITSEPRNGQVIDVECPTHSTALLHFGGGVTATLIVSFDVWGSTLPRIEVYGSEGTLSVPDPNTFGGPVKVYLEKDRRWEDVPLSHGYSEQSRAIGAADMAYALRSGRPHRAGGDMAFHVLDVMQTIYDSSDAGETMKLASTCDRPAALPVGLAPGTLDE